jgi:hypothetical protein
VIITDPEIVIDKDNQGGPEEGDKSQVLSKAATKAHT